MVFLKIQKLNGSSLNTKTCRFFSENKTFWVLLKYKNLFVLLKKPKLASSFKNTKLVFSKYEGFFSNYKNSLFLIQKHTPREASTRQRTEMSIEMEALNPNPERTDARPPLGRVGAPRVSRVMN